MEAVNGSQEKEVNSGFEERRELLLEVERGQPPVQKKQAGEQVGYEDGVGEGED